METTKTTQHVKAQDISKRGCKELQTWVAGPRNVEDNSERG